LDNSGAYQPIVLLRVFFLVLMVSHADQVRRPNSSTPGSARCSRPSPVRRSSRNSATTSAVRFLRARLRASAAELLAAGLRDFSLFCQDLPSGLIALDPKGQLPARAWLKRARGSSWWPATRSFAPWNSTNPPNYYPTAMIELLKGVEKRGKRKWSNGQRSLRAAGNYRLTLPAPL